MSGTGTTLKARESPDLLTHLCFAAATLLSIDSWISRDYQVCNAEIFALWESPRILFFFLIYHIQGCSENKTAFSRKNLYCKRQFSDRRDTCGLLCISPKVKFLYRCVPFPTGMLWEAKPLALHGGDLSVLAPKVAQLPTKPPQMTK